MVRWVISALVAGLLLVPSAANATETAYYTAVGWGAHEGVGLCLYPECMLTYDDSLAIDASNKPGAYGWARYEYVYVPDGCCRRVIVADISLGCVVIRDVSGGHVLYASGGGSDGRTYHLTVSVVGTAQSFTTMWDGSGPEPCGAFPLKPGLISSGAFQIMPAN
jgi:hypothetical protein